MSAGYIFKSTDSGAPVLNSSNGTMIALLKACLIDGYGAIAPAGGWKILLNDSGLRAVFQGNRATGGSGSVFSVRDLGEYDSGRSAGIRMFESVSDFDAGINGTAQRYLVKAFGGVPTPPWTVVADDKFVYFIVNNQLMFWFGDIVKFHSSDAYPAVLFGASGISGAGAICGQYNQSGDILRTLEKQVGPVTNITQLPGGVGYSYMGGAGIGLTAWPYYSQYVLDRPYLSSSANQGPRGFLPGLYVPYHYSGIFTHGNIYTIDSVNYTCIKWSSPAACCVLFDLANFRP